MGKPADKAKVDHVTKQIANTQRQLDHLKAIIGNPDSTQEEIDEALASLQEQTAKMDRLTGGPTSTPPTTA